MNKFLKYCFLILGWGFVILSLLFLSVFKNTDKAALFGSIGAFILFLQSIVEIKKNETVNKSIDIVGRKVSILYLVVSVILFISYFMFFQSDIKQIFLYDIRSNSDEVYVFLEFKDNNKIYRKKITEKTTKIRLRKNSKLYSVEHDNLFSTKVLSGNNTYEIYIFPNESVIEQENSYLVKEAQSVYAYFVEYYDYEKERNYYIFSKDNIIDKNSIISDDNTSLDILYKLQEEDLMFYNEDTQVLSSPYAGYVIKDQNNKLILLSNLWDTKLIY